MNIMIEKFNKKYSKNLSQKQTAILKEYIFAQTGNEKRLITLLESIKSTTVTEITKFSLMQENKILNRKIQPVLDEIKLLNPKEINDQNISKFLTLCQLRDQLIGEDHG